MVISKVVGLVIGGLSVIGALLWVTSLIEDRAIYKADAKQKTQQMEVMFLRDQRMEQALSVREQELLDLGKKQKDFRHDVEQAKRNPIYKNWHDSPLPVDALRLLNSSN